MTPSVLLLRHGETVWNSAGRLQGCGDSPLTARGLAQAGALARAARALGVSRVLASPLGRARATAERVAAAAGCTLAVRDCLAEMDFGTCAGFTLDELRASRPGILEARERDRWHHRWPGGESYADVLARVRAGLAGDAPLLTAGVTAVVAHQSVNRALLVWLGGGTPEDALAGDQPADVILRVEEGRAVWHAQLGSEPEGTPISWRPGIFRRAAARARSTYGAPP